LENRNHTNVQYLDKKEKTSVNSHTPKLSSSRYKKKYEKYLPVTTVIGILLAAYYYFFVKGE
jgi:hypothetical protein